MKKAAIPILIVLILATWGGIAYLLLTKPSTPDVASVYAEYRAAALRKDSRSIKLLATADIADSLNSRISSGTLKVPSDVTVAGVAVEGDKATLTLTGQLNNQAMSGKVTLAQVDGAWRIGSIEEWESTGTAVAQQPTGTTAPPPTPTPVTPTPATGELEDLQPLDEELDVVDTQPTTPITPTPPVAATPVETDFTPDELEPDPAPVESAPTEVADEEDDLNMTPGVTVYKPKTKPKPKASGTIAFRRRINWVQNPSTDYQLTNWIAVGTSPHVTTTDRDANPFFGLRKEGILYQDICLTGQQERVILVIARAYSERFNPQGDVTGYPQINGDWLNMTKLPAKMYGQMEAPTLTLRPRRANEWGVIMGVLEIPKKVTHVRLYLRSAKGLDEPGNTLVGFDDVGLYFFPNTEAAYALGTKFAEAAASMPR